eukprot:gi/632989484/ref/XP_007883674.1/ PREDICTED: uncharacterized protein LOC103172768 [Callorhinchus milii]
MTHGERAELQCAVTGFTPGTISIVSSLQRKEQPLRQLFHWEIPNKKAFRSSTKSFHLEDRSDRNNKDAAFTAEVPKCEPDTKDGTFRVTCRIVMTPNESTDDGAVLIVQVNHEALPVPFTEHFGINIAGDPPEINGPILPKQIMHGVKDTLQCQVTRFTPGAMAIVFSLRRKEQQQKVRLFHWEIPNKETFQEFKGRNVPLQNRSDRDNQVVSFTAEEQKCEPIGDGSFRVNCNINVIPDINLHDGAELTVEVHHEALDASIVKSVILHIIAVPPKITTIESKPKEIKHGEKTELQWAVTGFTPGKMSIISSLQRNGEQIRQLFHWEAQDKKTFEGKGSAFSLKHLSDGRNKDASFAAQVPKCEKDKDGTFRVKCSITVTPDVSRHNEAELTVQVQHEALGVCEPLIEKLKLHVTGGESASRQTQHSGRFK